VSGLPAERAKSPLSRDHGVTLRGVPVATPPQPRRVRMSAPERRKKIIAAATEVFIEQGYSGARTKEIAERAGVTEAFLYRHLASKEEMYEVSIVEPLRTGLVALAYDIEQIYDSVPDPHEFMNAVNERALRFYTEYATMQAVALYSELGNGRELYLHPLKPVLHRIGELIADRMGWAARGIDSELVRRAILGSQWAIGLDLLLRHRKVDLTEAAQRLTVLFTGGVRAK
jgi:AcrR family transcriptional regulator